MLTALRKEYPDSGYVFTTERGTPFTPDAINRLIKIIGKRAGIPFPVHFHMLRHDEGYLWFWIGSQVRGSDGDGSHAASTTATAAATTTITSVS